MPNYTNDLNLPQAVFDAIVNDPYDKGDSEFSVTELISPPQQKALQREHEDELTEDVSDRLWSLYGQLTHLLLERANKDDLAEERLFMVINGTKISGQIDSLSLAGGVLSDYKFTSSWGYKPGAAAKPEHVEQLNMQAMLLRSNKKKIKIEGLQIIALLRDWLKSRAKFDRKNEYPKKPIIIQPIPIWTQEECIRFTAHRIHLHKEARKGNVPECTKEERWKNGVRCESYCNVNIFCKQYQAIKQMKNEVFI